MDVIQLFVSTFYLYLLIGTVFAVFFVWRGAALLDDTAHELSWKMRALLFPGSMLLWPVLLRKWILTARNTVTKDHP